LSAHAFNVALAEGKTLKRVNPPTEVCFSINVFVPLHGLVLLAEVLEVMLTHELPGSLGQEVDIEIATYGVLEEEVVVLSIDARETGVELWEVGEVNESQHPDIWGELLVNLKTIVVGLQMAHH